mgnify:CR=1 FL=1
MMNDFTLFDSTNAPAGSGDILEGVQLSLIHISEPTRPY